MQRVVWMDGWMDADVDVAIFILIPGDGYIRRGGYRDDAAPRWLRVSGGCM